VIAWPGRAGDHERIRRAGVIENRSCQVRSMIADTPLWARRGSGRLPQLFSRTHRRLPQTDRGARLVIRTSTSGYALIDTFLAQTWARPSNRTTRSTQTRPTKIYNGCHLLEMTIVIPGHYYMIYR
jgi:hypothetical protein